jgi:hypothetical protein
VATRIENLRNTTRRKQARHAALDKGTHREQVYGCTRGIKTASQSERNLAIAKRVPEDNITGAQSLQRPTIRSTDRDRLSKIRREKTAVANDVVSTARVEKCVIKGYHRDQ